MSIDHIGIEGIFIKKKCVRDRQTDRLIDTETGRQTHKSTDRQRGLPAEYT